MGTTFKYKSPRLFPQASNLPSITRKLPGSALVHWYMRTVVLYALLDGAIPRLLLARSAYPGAEVTGAALSMKPLLIHSKYSGFDNRILRPHFKWTSSYVIHHNAFLRYGACNLANSTDKLTNHTCQNPAGFLSCPATNRHSYPRRAQLH